MRKTRVILVVICALGIGSLVWLLARDSEPSYKGRTLSSWLADIGVSGAANPNQPIPPIQPPEVEVRAWRAIKTMGTNAVPDLIRWAEYHCPAWKRTVYPLVNKFLSMFPTRFRVWDKEDPRAMRAAMALGEVGTVCEPVLRTIDRLCADSDVGVVLRGQLVLLGLAHRHNEAVLICLTNRSPDMRRSALHRVPLLDTNASARVAILIAALDDPDAAVASEAAAALGRYRMDYDKGIAALTRALRDPREPVRARAALALSMYGEAAASALPALRVAEKEESTVAENATEAIARIEDAVKTGKQGEGSQP